MRMTYDKAPDQGVELWREDTQKRDSGGYTLITEGLPAGKYIPKGTPLLVDTKKRTAKVLVRMRTVSDSSIPIHVAKGSLVKVGDTINNMEVDRIEEGAEYDMIYTRGSQKIVKGQVLTITSGKPNRLSYSPVKVEEGATIDAINAADEVQEDKMALTKEDKTSLGARFLFV